CVTARYSLILSRSKRALRRIFSAASAGISPSSAHASHAAISTSSQRWNFASSLQMAAISGREYRGITARVYPSPATAANTAPRWRLALFLHESYTPGAMQPHPIPEWDTELVELADGVFAYTQATGGFCISNAGFIAAGEESVAIDALFSPRMTQAFQDAVKKVAPSPVRSLINTHHHVDHTLGNALFPDAVIVAHAKAREEIARNGYPRQRLVATAPWFDEELPDEVPIRLPSVTFDTRLTMHAGDHRLELLHAGHAHTVGDILVHLPEQRILFAGDVCFFYVTPLAFEGNIPGLVTALHAIESMGDVDTIVPGHGPIGDK